MSTIEKPSNPKDLIGGDKLPLNAVPAVVEAYCSLANFEGLLKYGMVNWREVGVRTSIYYAALQRHLKKFYDAGEWADPKTHVPHLSSALACIGIILDARTAGTLTDDRPKPNPGLSKLLDDLGETVVHLKETFADKHPVHYTIDGPVGGEIPHLADVPENRCQARNAQGHQCGLVPHESDQHAWPLTPDQWLDWQYGRSIRAVLPQRCTNVAGHAHVRCERTEGHALPHVSDGGAIIWGSNGVAQHESSHDTRSSCGMIAPHRPTQVADFLPQKRYVCYCKAMIYKGSDERIYNDRNGIAHTCGRED